MGREELSSSSSSSYSELVHVLLVSFPGQGHVNPLLRLGKRLASKGLVVTFCTPESWGKQMRKSMSMSSSLGEGFIRFEWLEDGWGEEDARRQDLDQYLPQLEAVGKEVLPGMIGRQTPPVSCVINNPFIPWVSDVAHSLSLPSAMLWVQSSACFSAYYHYFHQLVPFPIESQPHLHVQLPCMPLLTHEQVPSFLYPSTPYPFLRRAILAQFRNLHIPFCILMDTFLELEQDTLHYMSSICGRPIKPVGPLFLNSNNVDGDDDTLRGDLLRPDECCLEWLDSKPPSSVVYISFGSVVYLRQEQVEEIAYGLLESGVSFLWVMKPPHKHSGNEPHMLPDGFLQQKEEKGRVVGWSPQERVLRHPSVACFVSHCGWNSSMEAIASGVPLVAFPQWGDQVTNAKYLVDVFCVAVRMCRGEAANELIKRDHVSHCLLEATVGPKAAEIKQNVLSLKAAAEAAVAEGGSSDRNIQAFVDEVRKRGTQIHSHYYAVSSSSVDPVADLDAAANLPSAPPQGLSTGSPLN